MYVVTSPTFLPFISVRSPYTHRLHHNQRIRAMAQQPLAKIALIICSTRRPRVGAEISAWVTSTINSVRSPSTTLTTLDLADHPLPISPLTVPAQLPVPLPENAYGHAAVDAWSKEIRRHDGFVFVTPQYNWSFPAALKCAIDHLFHEWAGKPALIVSYGSRGGNKGNAQLREVLVGIRMSPWEGKVELPLGASIASAVKGQLEGQAVEAWESGGQREALVTRWKELVEQVETKTPT